MLRLDRLIGDITHLEVRGDAAATEILALTNDSTTVRPGSLFFCLPGSRSDGHTFASDAIAAGAVALVVERPLPHGVVQVVVDDARRAMAPMAATFHDHPSRSLSVVGVTGTNGKTTTTFLLHSIFEAAGQPAGLVGTMSGARTTPEAPVLQAQLASFVAEGKRAAAIEVSSAGLQQHRVDDVWFSAAIFTNLSQDHLDDHGTMDAYFEAKASLFRPDRAALGVINADDEHGRRLLERAPIPMVAFSLDDARDLELGTGSSTFRWGGGEVRLPLDGAFNVANALAAATAARELGLDRGAIVEGLSTVGTVEGHAEPVEAGQDFRVVVDYAHTPLALESVLQAARRAAGDGGRVLVVFGCGGGRDPSKRQPMGLAASTVADVVIVTSDNPRDEDPDAIIASVVEGATGGAEVLVEPDRRAAIALGLGLASPSDVVVIAGKGHETGQTIAGRVLPFDDREVARELLSGRDQDGVAS